MRWDIAVIILSIILIIACFVKVYQDEKRYEREWDPKKEYETWKRDKGLGGM